MNKKGVEGAWWTMIVLLILLIVAIFVIYSFLVTHRKEGSSLDQLIKQYTNTTEGISVKGASEDVKKDPAHYLDNILTNDPKRYIDICKSGKDSKGSLSSDDIKLLQDKDCNGVKDAEGALAKAQASGVKGTYETYLSTKDAKLLDKLKGTVYYDVVSSATKNSQEFKNGLSSLLPKVISQNDPDLLLDLCDEIFARYVQSLELFGGDISFLSETDSCYQKVLQSNMINDQQKDLTYFNLGYIYDRPGNEEKAYGNYLKIKDIEGLPNVPTTIGRVYGVTIRDATVTVKSFFKKYLEEKKSPLAKAKITVPLGIGQIYYLNQIRMIGVSQELNLFASDEYGGILYDSYKTGINEGLGITLKVISLTGDDEVCNEILQITKNNKVSDIPLKFSVGTTGDCKGYIKTVELDLSTQTPRFSVASAYAVQISN